MTGLALFHTTTVIAQAGLLAFIVERSLVAQAEIAALAGPLTWLLVVLSARALSETARGWLAAGASARIRMQLRPKLFERMADTGPALRGRAGSGALATTLVEQVDALDSWYARFLPQLVIVAVLVPAVLVTVWLHDWLAGLLLTLAVPLIPFFMVLIGIGTEQLSRQQQLALARLGGAFLDRLRGLDTIRRFGAEQREFSRVAALIEDFRSRTMGVLKLAFLSTAVMEFFSAVAIAAIAIYVGLALLGHIGFGPAGEMELRTGLFILLLAPEFFLPLRQLSQFWHDRASARAAAADLRSVLNTPPARPEPKQPSGLPDTGICRVEIRGLGLSWRGRGPVLTDLHADIDCGQRVLITGPSGSGKSTLLQALAGFIAADTGSIKVNSVDLADLSREDLARLRGWLGQQPGLFDGTIADNIRLGGVDTEAAAIDTAVRLAGAATFINRLPAGLATRITQDGEGLSGGQARRIALARTLVRPRPLLLLDEPTASLDADTAADLWRTIGELSLQRRMTIICASHDPAARSWADRVLMLVDGRLEEPRP